MKTAFRQKHPFITATLYGLLCTFLTALGFMLSQFITPDADQQMAVTTVFLVVSIMIGLLIMKKSQLSLAAYGFCRDDKEAGRKIFWYLPLLIVEILPVAMMGFRTDSTLPQHLILLLFCIAVGFNEEIFFRSLIYKVLQSVGRKKAITGSAIIFGVLHLANALNGKNLFSILLQVLFAALTGIVLAEIFSITRSLWVLIIWHAAHDYIASICAETLTQRDIILAGLQTLVLLLYALVLWKTAVREELGSHSKGR